jgi:DNA polymerase-1
LPGYKIVSADYSQIEVRIAAFYANDEVLVQALEKEDVHTAIAAEVFGVPENSVTKEQRKHAKALTFTLLFGGGAGTLYQHSRMTGGSISEADARTMSSKFFGRFDGLRKMRDKAYKMADKDGPAIIRLPNGTRRILVGYNKRHTTILNSLVQGSAAVGLKYGLLEAHKQGLSKWIGGTVHDEIIAAVPNKEAKTFAKELEQAMVTGMQNVIDTTVRVESKIGSVWQA